jgi:nucleoside-diphosphate-sugar epimerase
MSMHVAIAGGHGKVALRLTSELRARGDRVRSLIRNPAHVADVEAAGGEPLLCDLETAGQDELARIVASADAVIFAAGAGSGSGPERKWTMDYGGAVKLVAAAKANRIDRYVMLSSRGADPEAPDTGTFGVYLRAKGQADAELRASGLAYTIVRPGWLTDDPGTGRIRAAPSVGDGKISRDDVAAVLAVTVHDRELAGVTFEAVRGETPIEVALTALERAATGSSGKRDRDELTQR